MKNLVSIFIITLFLLTIIASGNSDSMSNMAFADNRISNPGGSPFAPGEEPSLTHTVDVFWITSGDIDRTEITVKIPGDKPTQVDGFVPKVSVKGWTKGNPVSAMIAPDCNYKFVFLQKKSGRKTKYARVFHHTGMGTLNIRIFGWKNSDSKVVPTVTAKYYKGDTLMGTTAIKAYSISTKIKKREKK